MMYEFYVFAFPTIYIVFHQSPERCKHGVPLYLHIQIHTNIKRLNIFFYLIVKS
jgi:hypothetical protein